jgi:peptidoglycan/LPS O-acetylase OafA/YrhL
VWLGRISYGLYVIHLPVLQLGLGAKLHDALGLSLTRSVSAFAVDLPLTIVLAALSWYLIEKHFIALKHRFAS